MRFIRDSRREKTLDTRIVKVTKKSYYSIESKEIAYLILDL